MLRFGEFIAKHRVLILLTGIILLIPSVFGYINTRVNYDILSYLPKDINTMVGQDILIDEFGQGGFSFVMVDGMTEEDFALWLAYHRAICEREDLVGLSFHTLDILRKENDA